jgi:hypothetical protein
VRRAAIALQQLRQSTALARVTEPSDQYQGYSNYKEAVGIGHHIGFDLTVLAISAIACMRDRPADAFGAKTGGREGSLVVLQGRGFSCRSAC